VATKAKATTRSPHKGKAHDDSTRAAVMAALLAGQGVSEVARQFKLSKSVVSRMKSEISKGELEQVGTKKQIEFGEKLGDYLSKTLDALAVQAELFGDETYLRGQPVSDLAVLHGIQADKAVRLLEAIERANGVEENQ
jgi:transposase-like protein